MKSYVVLPWSMKRQLPDEFRNNDMRYPDSLVEYFVEELTNPGDTVFDPFAGYGTTLLVAEEMGRVAFGIESDKRRFDYTRSLLSTKENLILGDSRDLDRYQLPQMDLVLTSPIFMRSDETRNPLTGYKELGTYHVYLDELQEIFRKIGGLLKHDARVIVEVWNLRPRDDRPMTLLAWDIARSLSRVLTFEKEIIACWEEVGDDSREEPQKNGYEHSYCLVFRQNDS